MIRKPKEPGSIKETGVETTQEAIIKMKQTNDKTVMCQQEVVLKYCGQSIHHRRREAWPVTFHLNYITLCAHETKSRAACKLSSRVTWYLSNEKSQISSRSTRAGLPHKKDPEWANAINIEQPEQRKLWSHKYDGKPDRCQEQPKPSYSTQNE